MITTEWFFGSDGLDEAHMIRRKVFIEEQGISEADEMDGTDVSCAHLVAYDEGVPVATGRIMITADEYIIGRVAVLPEYRGQKLGSLVMLACIHACNEMGGKRQVVHAQLPVKGFYEGLGFSAYGDVYEEAGIQHICMEHFGECSVCFSELMN